MASCGFVCGWTAPFLERFHETFGAGDYYRFTCEGAWELFRSAGFRLLRRAKVADTQMASGALLGFGVGDFEVEHEREKLLLPFDRRNDSIDGTLSISCALVVQKPWLAEGSEVAARCRRRRNGCVVGASKSPADVDAPNHRASGPHGGVHPRRAEGSARVGSR